MKPSESERQRRRENMCRAMGWGGSKTLATIDGCPECDAVVLSSLTVATPALFVHGGFGATLTTSMRWCAGCGYEGPSATTETRPPRP